MPAFTNRVVRIVPPKKGMFDKMAQLADSLTSLVTGMGGAKDKLATSSFVFNPITPMECEAMYRSDWISRKAIDIPPYDATREWRTWQGDPDQITALEDVEKTLGIQQKVMLAMQKARLYGGGALILGVNQGRNEEELDYEKLKAEDLRFVHAVSRYDISIGPLVRDIASPYYGEPEYYERSASAVDVSKEAQANAETGGVRFHPSRVVPFIGAPRQDMISAQDGWGDPLLQIIQDSVKATGLVTNSVAQLVAEAKTDIIKIPGLTENITNVDYEARLMRRFGVANVVKGVYSMLLIDREEEWERQNAQFSGLPDILSMYLLMVSGAADIPVTRFLGQSPSGMNATGESDIRNYYDAISAQQRVVIAPRLARLDNVLVPSALGDFPEELFYVWNPLWQMTEKERAEIANAKADVMTKDANAALIDMVVLRKAREAQLIEDGIYPGFEQILEEFDGAEEEEAQASAEAAGFGTPEEQEAAAAAARGENDPDKNPDDMPLEGEGNDPATKPKPKRARPRDRRMEMRFHDTRSRTRFTDATPRTLYVRRNLLNGDAIAAWAKSQGYDSILNDLHVTLIYSKERVDWVKAWSDPWDEEADGNLTIRAGGMRCMEQFGTAQVLVFGSDKLTYRNMNFRHRGCSYEYEEYNPHVTITYRDTPNRLPLVEPYQGELRFGPEIWEEINPSGYDEQDPKVERMLDGGHRVVMQQGLDAEQVEKLVASIMDKLPKPTVTVDNTAPDPNLKYKEITVVTKHDDKGRFLEFERRKVLVEGDEGQG